MAAHRVAAARGVSGRVGAAPDGGGGERLAAKETSSRPPAAACSHRRRGLGCPCRIARRAEQGSRVRRPCGVTCVPLMVGCMEAGLLSEVHSRCIVCDLSPESMQDATKLLDAIVEGIREAKAVATLLGRLQYWGIPFGEDEVAEWARRLRVGMRRVAPLQRWFDVVRVVCSAVCASPRFQYEDAGCLWSCGRADSDGSVALAHSFPSRGSLVGEWLDAPGVPLDADAVDNCTLVLRAMVHDAI